MNKKDYYNLFIKYSQQQCMKNDCNDKSKVKAHNVASKQLQQLQSEMKRHDCTKILCELLSHHDIRVRINAASMCMQTGVLIEKAKTVLEHIAISAVFCKFYFAESNAIQQRSILNAK